MMPPKGHKPATEPAAVYAVCGTETFLKQRALAQITNRVLGQADRSLALSEYDGASGSLELADLLDDLRTLPFLTDRRLILLRNADDFISRCRQELEDYVENPSPTGVLVIECKTLAANTRLYKRISAVGEVIKCEPIKGYQVPQWIVCQCRESQDKQIDDLAADMLCNLVGTDLGQLDTELAKLSIYVGDRKRITPDDVQALVGVSREEVIWGVMTAILAGDRQKALLLWEDVWQTDRAASARAIGGLAFKVRQLLNAKRAQEAGAPRNELARMMMIFRDPQRLDNELAAFSTEQIEQMLCKLVEADVAAKTGRASVRSSVEAFVIEPRAKRLAGGYA